MKRINGLSFSFFLFGELIAADSITLTINDERATKNNNGVPNGRLLGKVSADGEITLDALNFKLVIEAARKAGSFRNIEPTDAMFYAKHGDEELKVEAFGMDLRVSDLLNIDPESTDASQVKLPFMICSKEFIKINGVPYLDGAETQDVVSSAVEKGVDMLKGALGL